MRNAQIIKLNGEVGPTWDVLGLKEPFSLVRAYGNRIRLVVVCFFFIIFFIEIDALSFVQW